MKQTKQKAKATNIFAKTHKSRKTEPDAAPETALAVLDGAPPTDPATAPPPASTNEKPAWWRPADSKVRAKVNRIVVARAAGHKDAEIAKRMKTTAETIRHYMYLARKNGWLDEEDEPIDLEAEMAFDIDRKVVRNIGSSLDGNMTNWQTHEMTLAAAKGRGFFKGDSSGKQEGASQMAVVAIQVIMPPIGAGDQQPTISDDQMGGVPAYIEGEVESGDDGADSGA